MTEMSCCRLLRLKSVPEQLFLISCFRFQPFQACPDSCIIQYKLYAALMTPLALWDRESDVIGIERGGTLQEKSLAEKLVAFGYEKSYQVENPGQFSIRGGIIDIFDLTEENPYRIELWGDEVESIRSFDVLSQRSIEKLESISVFPASEFVLDDASTRQHFRQRHGILIEIADISLKIHLALKLQSRLTTTVLKHWLRI